jgi:transposase
LEISCGSLSEILTIFIAAFGQGIKAFPQDSAISVDSQHKIVYIRIMPSLQDYAVRGKRYWRIVESYRDERGRPRIRVVRHLGTAQKLLDRLSEAPGRPLFAEERDFGATAALWDTAQQLDIIGTIDGHAPKRDQGTSVGTYILLATLNRAISPTSKCKLASWYRDTILVRLLPLRAPALRSQRFWDHMNYLDEPVLAEIENDITRRVVEGLNVDLRALFYDTTNFDTFLSSDNPAELAQRGHAKSKRTDLRIVGLALLVSWDFHIPLFSKAYEGNQNDSVTFSQVLDDLIARYQMFKEKCQSITLVFDKGNNSEENIQALEGSPYHFIGSLVPAQHQDLLDIPLERFRYLKDPLFEGVRVHRTEKEIFGQKRTIVITRSRALLQGQVRGIRQHLAKKLKALHDLQKRVARSHECGWKGKPYTEESLQKNLDKIVSGQYIADFLWGKVTRKHGRLGIEFGTDENAYNELKRRVLGKRILFTDREDLTDEEIIFGYRGQHHVERAFRDMKDPYFISFSPAHHWTDQMLRVHAFYCVLALTLVSLLHRRVHQAGINISQSRLMQQLKRIKEITNYYPAQSTETLHIGGRPRSERTLTRLDSQQNQIFRALHLEQFVAS